MIRGRAALRPRIKVDGECLCSHVTAIPVASGVGAPVSPDDLARLPTAAEPLTRIEATNGWGSLRAGELWRHRDLVYFFAWRDVKVRYKQTALGVSWAIIQPLVTMVLFVVVFHNAAGVTTGDVSYQAFALAGLVAWTFISNGFGLAANALVGNATLLGKIYFPRLALPLGNILGALVDLAIATALTLVLLPVFGQGYTIRILTLPLFAAIAVVAALGIGIWLSALYVYYRDVRYALPFITQALLFLTPIAYPASSVDGRARIALALNPVTAPVEGFRWALLGTSTLSVGLFVVSLATGAVVLVTGLAYFVRTERAFADVI